MQITEFAIVSRAAHLGVAFAAAALLTGPVRANDESEPRRVNEEILDILLEQGDIDRDRYEELKAREQAEHEASQASQVEIFYSNALRIEGEDWKVKIGGRIQADFATIHVDDDLRNAFDDEADPADASPLKGDGEGVEFRRARIYLSGDIYDRVIYRTQLDFADAEVSLNDVYIGMKGLGPFGTVRVGHFYEPFSLEELTSSKYITFMERSLSSVFDPSRNFGIGFRNQFADDRLTVAAGVFAPTGDGGSFFSNDTNFNLTARVTGLPIHDGDEGDLVHLGLSFSQRIQDDETESFSQRPEVHLAEQYLFTGDYVSDGATLVAPEIAIVVGPWHAAAEWKHAWLDRNDGNDWEGKGAYLQAGFFLTGETRPYDTARGTFARLEPNHPFDPAKGDWGAWELAARVSFLDLNDSGTKGGEENNFSIALNWYLYSFLRLQLDYVYADVEDTGVSPAFGTRGGGDIHTFQMRAGLEF